MKVQLKAFGIAQELVTIHAMDIERNITIKQLREKLENDFPQLKQIEIRFAINKRIATDSDLLHNSDEVAVMPPFSGG